MQVVNFKTIVQINFSSYNVGDKDYCGYDYSLVRQLSEVYEKEAAAAVITGTAVATTATPTVNAGATTADATPKSGRSGERGRGGRKKYVLHLDKFQSSSVFLSVTHQPDSCFRAKEQDTDELINKRGGCGAQQLNITVDGMKMVAEFTAPKKKTDDQDQLPEPVERKQILSDERVLNVLKRISDEDCLLMGLNPKYARPDWMILQVLPDPPPHVRPSVMMDTSSRSEDDLTHQLAMLIRHNENLRRQERNGAPAHIIIEFAPLLQFHIATYFDNDLPGQPRVSGLECQFACIKSTDSR
ncbi:DNA-directed RNA polymerase [Zea mays]|uniref:DNA-directed RNA polymerase n=1 Tax=Zea mays TaxID=4577 RepID=A0A1D6KUJ9_MAIZE|nr:DNA-directed RNA polymerase [Zea mays]